jgi:hypothetical protein
VVKEYKMRYFGKSKDSEHQKNSVLFVCVENAGRSQMAEGFFRKYSPEGDSPVGYGLYSMFGDSNLIREKKFEQPYCVA